MTEYQADDPAESATTVSQHDPYSKAKYPTAFVVQVNTSWNGVTVPFHRALFIPVYLKSLIFSF